MGGFFIGSQLHCAVSLSILMALLLASESRASGLEAKSSRAPLPAREVARPLVLPKGWLDVSIGAEREYAGVPGAWTERLSFRRGIVPRHELSLAVGGVGPSLGWRVSLLQGAAPSSGLALALRWDRGGWTRFGFAVRRQWGALRLTGRLDGLGRSADGQLRGAAEASAEALLQAGPLGWVAEPVTLVSGREAERASELRVGALVQWTRGFDTRVTGALPLSGTRSRRLGLALGGRF